MSKADPLLHEWADADVEIKKLMTQMHEAVTKGDYDAALACIGDIQNTVSDLEQTLEDAASE